MLRALVTLLVCLLPLVSAFSPQAGALAACRSAAPAISSTPARRRPAQLSRKEPRSACAWLSKRPGSGCAVRWWLPARLVLTGTLRCARLPSQWRTTSRKRPPRVTMPSDRRRSARPTSSASRRPTRRSPTSRGTRSLRVCRSRRAAAAPPRAHESALPLRAS